ncbi:MAG: hypothetical protein WCA20_37370, partial [Candidatus Sulfotelmatobacter sp.]
MKRILATVGPPTYVTKVPTTRARAGMLLALCLTVLPFPPAWGEQATPAQAAPAQAHRPGPAESLYLQLNSVGLDAARVFTVRGASLER